jgi:ferredoxin-fold anticodon binding domain-containing protein
MENVLINKLELASELAHRKLVENWYESIQIYEDEYAGITNYTDEAQDIFNELYDEYLQLIEELTIK